MLGIMVAVKARKVESDNMVKNYEQILTLNRRSGWDWGRVEKELTGTIEFMCLLSRKQKRHVLSGDIPDWKNWASKGMCGVSHRG